MNGMMTPAEAVTAIRENEKNLVELKRVSQEYGGKIPQLEKAVNDLQESTRALVEARNVLAAGTPDARGVGEFVVQNKSLTDMQPLVQTTAEEHANAGVLRGQGDQAVVLRTMFAKDGEEIPGLLDTPAEPGSWTERAQVLHDRFVLMRAMNKSCPKTRRAIQRHWERAPIEIRSALGNTVSRIFADSSAIGAEFIPDVVSTRLEMNLRAQRRVAALFEEIDAPKEWRVPFLDAGLTAYLKAGATSDDPAQFRKSSVATAQRTFTAVGLAVRTQLDADADEDSIIPAQQLLEGELAAAINDAEEDAILNGDTAATHQDSALSSWNPRSRWTVSGGSDDHRKGWIGLRARAFDVSNTTDRTASNTYAGFMSEKKNLAAPHGTEGDTVMITSPEQYLFMLGNWTQLITLDLYGAGAAILTGEIARIGNTPVVQSEFLTADLQTTGLFTSTGGTTSGYLVLNRKRFLRTRTRGITLERDKDITRGVWHLVATKRGVFGSIDSSTKKNVGFAFNL